MKQIPSWLTSVARVSTTLPISLTDLKAHLSVSGSQDDTRLSQLEWGAIDFIENITNRYLVPTTVTETWTYFPTLFAGGHWEGYGMLPFYPYPLMQTPSGLPWHWGEMQRMELTKSPVTSSITLTYYDVNNVLQTLVQGTDFYAVTPVNRPAFLQPVTVWQIPYYRPDAVNATYTAGYTVLPSKADIAIKLLVGHLNEHREAQVEVALTTLEFGLMALIQSLGTGAYY